MVSKDLKRLSRRDLVDIIYQMKKDEQKLLDQIAALQAELEDKRVRISEAGSIAEAAVSITNVYNEAQKAADMYLQEIASMKATTEEECKRIIEEASTKAQTMEPDPNKPRFTPMVFED
ncbi:MAG: DNA repair protein [Clostridia bacterium]|nr:DNA repair protein [Clostridia bacterium]